MTNIWTGERTIMKAEITDLKTQAAAVTDEQLACRHELLRWYCCELCGESGRAEECAKCGVPLGTAGRKIRQEARRLRRIAGQTGDE